MNHILLPVAGLKQENLWLDLVQAAKEESMSGPRKSSLMEDTAARFLEKLLGRLGIDCCKHPTTGGRGLEGGRWEGGGGLDIEKNLELSWKGCSYLS
ncbi:hypothetical protein KS4_09650 [Poriferisphaera corsica]|uniref:Uncharacterized protein n=1 Tax=Poriferisphaera corsica TaxID=2528020 RepID=A0A517YRT8_9BACT|nr:hypothetical protein [Poriferisphaera corsica]QDU32926.1 hypothetical protein KS4_09650 [Poriferisphaera corsica]